MKILQINKFYRPEGGVESYMFRLSRILEKNGHQVVPFSMRDEKNLPTPFDKYFISPVNVEKFSLKNLVKIFHNWEAVRQLKVLIKKEKPDLAHLHNIDYQISPAIIKILKNNNIPVVKTFHDYKLICPNYQLFSQNEVCFKCRGGKYYNCALRKCAKNSRAKSFLAMLEAYWQKKITRAYDNVDMFIAPSRFMKDITASFGVPAEKIKVVYNTIEIDQKNIEYPAKNYLLYFGRISSEKGIDILLRAMAELKNESLKIAGDGPEIGHCRALAKKLGLENRVEFLGKKNGQELEKIIREAKAIVIPSIWLENMPYSMLESLAYGKIVIASRIGGMPEIIIDGENGILFNPGDSRSLAEAVYQLKNINSIKIGEQARKSVMKLNRDSHYGQIFQIYTEALKKLDPVRISSPDGGLT